MISAEIILLCEQKRRKKKRKKRKSEITWNCRNWFHVSLNPSNGNEICVIRGLYVHAHRVLTCRSKARVYTRCLHVAKLTFDHVPCTRTIIDTRAQGEEDLGHDLSPVEKIWKPVYTCLHGYRQVDSIITGFITLLFSHGWYIER